MKNSILFAEWISENHYVLINFLDGVYYWKNEYDIKTTKELYEIWVKNK